MLLFQRSLHNFSRSAMLIVLHFSIKCYWEVQVKGLVYFFPSYLIMIFSKPIQFQFCKCVDMKGETVIYWLRLEMQNTFLWLNSSQFLTTPTSNMQFIIVAFSSDQNQATQDSDDHHIAKIILVMMDCSSLLPNKLLAQFANQLP